MADIRESTVHFFKKRYIEVLKKAKHSGATVPEVKSIALRKRGCPLTLGDVYTKVQAYIMALRKAGTPVNLNIVLAAAEQWRRKIVKFRGAGARRRAALPCFSPANIELFIAMNSPDDSLLYCLGCTQSHCHQIQTNYQLLHFFQS